MDEKNKIKPGDLFQTSWGYDQTNYDFIIVKSISPSGKTAICQKAVKQFVSEESSMTIDALKPKAEGFGPEFRLRIYNPKWEGYEGRIMLRGSYPFLSRYEDDWSEEQKENWSKSTRLDTFSICEDNRTYGQTNPMFGH